MRCGKGSLMSLISDGGHRRAKGATDAQICVGRCGKGSPMSLILPLFKTVALANSACFTAALLLRQPAEEKESIFTCYSARKSVTRQILKASTALCCNWCTRRLAGKHLA